MQNRHFLFDGYLIGMGGKNSADLLHFQLGIPSGTPRWAFFAIFRTKSDYFVNFLSEMLAFKLFLERKRV
jgi:hypothetical protein